MSQNLDGKIDPARIRAGSGGVLTSDGIRASWQPSGGGGALGTAELFASWSGTTVFADGSWYDCTSLSVTGWEGDPGLSVASTSLSYDGATDPGVFITTAYLYMTYDEPSTGVLAARMYEPLLGTVRALIHPVGYEPWNIPFTSQYHATTTFAGIPSVNLRTVDDPAPYPEMTIEMYLYVTRFAAP